MAHDEQPIPHATLETCQMHYSALVALAEATIALGRARDLVLMAHGSTTAAASVHVLHGAALALVNELGAELMATGRSSDESAVKHYVALVASRLHHEPRVTVPPSADAP